MSKISCVLCQALVLEFTFTRNHGLCGVCMGDINHLVRCTEVGCFEQVWPSYLSDMRVANTDDERIQKQVLALVDKLVDKNLQALLSSPNLQSDYFFLQPEPEQPNKLIGEYQRDCAYDVYELLNCKTLSDDWHCPAILFSCKLQKIPPIPLVAGPFMIFSREVVNLIADIVGQTVQYVPVIVKAKNGTTDNYLAVNLLHSYDVWDLEISTWQGIAGIESKPFYMRNMMARNDLNINCHLFRNKQYSSLIVVSKKLGDVLFQALGQSITLQNINKWSNC